MEKNYYVLKEESSGLFYNGFMYRKALSETLCSAKIIYNDEDKANDWLNDVNKMMMDQDDICRERDIAEENISFTLFKLNCSLESVK